MVYGILALHIRHTRLKGDNINMSEENKSAKNTEEKKDNKKVEAPKEKVEVKVEVKKEAPKEEAKTEPEEKVEVPPKADQPQSKADEHTAEKVEEKAEAPKEEAAKPEAGESKGKKRKKINLMTLSELEAKLKSVKDKMGNLKSRYAQQLLKQKDILSK